MRLSLRTLTEQEEAQDRLLLVRMYAYFFFAGALISYLTLVVPHEGPGFDWSTLALATLSLIGGMFAFWKQHWFASVTSLFVLSTFGSMLITLAIVLSPTHSSAKAFFYMWVSIFAFYCLPWRIAILQLVMVGTMFAGALWYVDPPYDALEHWIVVFGTLSTLGSVAYYLRNRLHQLMSHLRDAAMHDPLTGLLNRRGIRVQFEHARTDQVALLVCDIDFFRQVNDSFGHAYGDRVLIDLGQSLAELAEGIPGATCGRDGGEEFVLVLPGHDVEAATAVAERVRDHVERSFAASGTDVTFSLGVAQMPEHAPDAVGLFEASDIALYAAKEFGRNRTVVFDENLRTLMPSAAARRATEREIHIATLATLAEVLDLRHQGTADHSQTVGNYAEATARELGMSEQQVDRVRVAGMLHDIGKIGIPDSILLKPSSLTDDEFARMKSHPVIGARILSAMDLTDIREWVLYHHERPDGRGYPRGLEGDEIPLGAAILAIADTYEAMTADRVYRAGMAPEAARAELVRVRGTQFSETVVDAFLRVLDRAAADAEFEAAPDQRAQLDDDDAASTSIAA